MAALLCATTLAACSSDSDPTPTASPVTLSGTISGPEGAAMAVSLELTDGTNTYSTATNVQGDYTFAGVPRGTYSLVIDGSTVVELDGSPADDLATYTIDAFVVEPGALPFGASDLRLPTVDAIATFALDGQNQAVIPVGTELRVPGNGPAVRFGQTTVATFPEGSDGTLYLSETSPASMPNAPFGETQAPAGGLYLGPEGVTFDVDPQVLLPNRAGLPANTTDVEIVSLSPDGTETVAIGTGTVDPTGRYIVPDPSPSPTPGVGSTVIDWSRWAGWVAAHFESDHPNAIVQGTLTDASGDPVADCEVLLDGWGAHAQTASGSYSGGVSTLLWNSTVQVSARAAGHLRATRGVATSAGQTATCDLVLEEIQDVDGPPQVTALVPADGAAGVPRKVTVQVTFNEFLDPIGSRFGLEVMKSSRVPSTPYLHSVSPGLDEDYVFGRQSMATGPGGTTLSYIVINTLQPGTEYSILATHNITDQSGNRFVERPNSYSSAIYFRVIGTFTTSAIDPGTQVAVATTPNVSTTLDLGKTVSASATVTDTASSTVIPNATVTWSSSDPSVATVTRAGVVRGVGAGTATITALADGTETSDSFPVTVQAPNVDSIAMTDVEAHPLVGRTLLASATPRDAAGEVLSGLPLTWTSSDDSVATVDTFGSITTVGAGTATISVNVLGDANVAQRSLTVHAPSEIDSIALGSALEVLEVGDTGTLTGQAFAGTTAIAGVPVTFTSSSTSVLSLDGFTYTAATPGLSTVTATAAVEGSTFTRDINVTVAAVGSAGARVLGAAKAVDPANGATVIRHDVTDGTFVESVSTDSAGLATFSNANETTLSLSVFEIAGTTTRLRSLLGVARGIVPISAAPTGTTPVVEMTATGSPQAIDLVVASAGRHGYAETFVAPTPPATMYGISLAQLQTDGKVSAFIGTQDSPSTPAYAAPSDALMAAGFLLDADPAVLDGTSQVVAVSANALTSIPFDAGEAQVAPAGGFVLRKGVVIPQRFGVGSETSTGNSSLALPEGWSAALLVHEASTTSTRRRYTPIESVPSSAVDVTLPALALDSVTWTAGTLSWTLSGEDASSLDIGRARIAYTTSGFNRVEWTVWFDPSRTSVTVPGLPVSMADVQSGYDLISYDLEFFDIEGRSGYDAAIAALEGGHGSLERALMSLGVGADAVATEGSGNGGGGGGGGMTDHTLAITIEGFGTGDLTVDSGAGPVAVFDGDFLTIPDNTSVTVTAVGTNGSVVTYFETPNFFSFNGNPSETDTFTITDDGAVIVEFD